MVTPASVMRLGRGEQVQLANQTGEPVALVAVFAASSSMRALGGWPTSYPVRITAGGVEVALPERPGATAHG